MLQVDAGRGIAPRGAAYWQMMDGVVNVPV